MQTKTALALLTTLSVVGLGFSASAKTVDKEKFTGSQAATSFSISQNVTCADGSTKAVSGSGFLSASDSVTKETGTPKTTSNGVSIDIFNYSNGCTGSSVGFGEGGIANAYTPPNNNKLNSAGVSGSGTVQDLDFGNTITIALDLVFEGTGPLTSGKSHSKTKTTDGKGNPITIEIDRNANANRSADVSGTITLEGFELDPVFSSATLSSNASTDITITKN